MAEPTALERLSNKVNDQIEDACGAVAHVVVKRPRQTIAAQLCSACDWTHERREKRSPPRYLITVLCACGFSNLAYDDLPERLYVPQDTKAFDDRKWVEDRDTAAW